jgi:hypothetical protein
MFFITNSRQNKQKKRKTGFSVMKQENIGHHRLHEAEEEEALERLSLFFFLSLSVGKKYTLQEGTASDSFCAVYITAFSGHSVVYSSSASHPSIKREREKGRERKGEIRDLSLSRARTAREQLKRAGRDTKQKTSLFSCSFVFVSKTGS